MVGFSKGLVFCHGLFLGKIFFLQIFVLNKLLPVGIFAMLCVVGSHVCYRVILFNLVIPALCATITYKPPVDVGFVPMCASFRELLVEILFESSLL
jgi:hypothetical protein